MNCQDLLQQCLDIQVQIGALDQEISLLALFPWANQSAKSLAQKRDTLRAELQLAFQAFFQCMTGLTSLGSAPTNLSIVGTERTQGIQYWNRPAGQGSGYAPDNSVPLVSQKETILRVYVDAANRTGRYPIPTTVTGDLSVSGPGVAFNAAPLAGAIAARSISSVNRSTLHHTLNFTLPASLCHDYLECKLTVFDPQNPGDADSTTLFLNFVDVPPLPMRCVAVHYTGVDFYDQPVDAEPGWLDFGLVLTYVLRAFPIGALALDLPCDVIEWDKKIALTPNFLDLFHTILVMRAFSGTDEVYFGLYPREAGCGGLCGYGGWGAALSMVGDGPGAGHELGHALGRKHTQCAMNAPDPDPGYPTYAGYPAGSIGEVGLDPIALTVYDPSKTFDFMSYCVPRWVSPYTYVALMESVIQLGSTEWPLELGFAANTVPTDFLNIFLRLHRESDRVRVEVMEAFHIPRQPPREGPPESTEVTLELLAVDGSVLAVHPCTPVIDQGDRAPFREFRAIVPCFLEIDAVRVVEAGKVVSLLKRAQHSPSVEILTSELTAKPTQVRLAWRGSVDDDVTPPLRYAVRYSADRGVHWRGLVSGLTREEHVVDLDRLPGGDSCLFQVVASAGLRTSIAVTEPFSVPKRPRIPYIVSPLVGAEFDVGTRIALLGSGFSPDFGIAPSTEVQWRSETLGLIGVGYQLATDALQVGVHHLTMTFPDGTGRQRSGSVEIRVVDRGAGVAKRGS